LIKNSQPFGKKFQKTVGGGGFLTHTVVHHTPKMSARLYDVGTLLYYNKFGRYSTRTQVNLVDHPDVFFSYHILCGQYKLYLLAV